MQNKTSIQGPLTKFSQCLNDCQDLLHKVEHGDITLSPRKLKMLQGEISTLKLCEEKEIQKGIADLEKFMNVTP